MYNDTIKVANKIISYDDLFEIFSFMNEKLLYYKKIFHQEEMKNKMLEYNYQTWTFKDIGSSLLFNVNFYDDTSIQFDNYNNFLTVFNNRLDEIKSLWVHFHLSYYASLPDGKKECYNQHINMDIYETRMNINISLSSADKKIDDVYQFVKKKVLTAPEKYDDVVRKKGSISFVVEFAIGLIPALIIFTLLLFVPNIRHLFAASYVLYPLCCCMLGFLIGKVIGSMKIDDLYQNIIPEKKYVGYDSANSRSIYKDDIDKYVQTSEILIGKNVDNLKCREKIMKYYNKYKKYIPFELGILVVLSILVLFLGEI